MVAWHVFTDDFTFIKRCFNILASSQSEKNISYLTSAAEKLQLTLHFICCLFQFTLQKWMLLTTKAQATWNITGNLKIGEWKILSCDNSTPHKPCQRSAGTLHKQISARKSPTSFSRKQIFTNAKITRAIFFQFLYQFCYFCGGKKARKQNLCHRKSKQRLNTTCKTHRQCFSHTRISSTREKYRMQFKSALSWTRTVVLCTWNSWVVNLIVLNSFWTYKREKQ